MPRFIAVGLMAVCCFGSALAADKVTLKVAKSPVPKEIHESIAGLLDDEAIVLNDDKGELIATVWFRKKLPSTAAPEQVKSGLTYREVMETAVVGAIQFPNVWSDYRKQRIPAGVYTLRLAFQPQNGDHQGTAPYNEFCLLSPAAKDTLPGKMQPKELYELSVLSTGGSHPAVMMLYPNSKPADAPAVASKPMDVWVLNSKRPVDVNGETVSLGFSFTIIGHSTQE